MSHIFPPIREALTAMIRGFTEGSERVSEESANSMMVELVPLFSHVGDFRKKLDSLDIILESHPEFALLEPYIFDLLILSFIISDSTKLDPEYLESEEWMKIEDETSDRGSEMLNLYLYLTEAKDQKLRPDLEDYLHEFLLTDDEVYQDEFFIYEDIIRNIELIEAGVPQWTQTADKIGSEALAEIFVALFAFFAPGDMGQMREALRNEPKNKAINLALYEALIAYQEGLKEVDMNG